MLFAGKEFLYGMYGSLPTDGCDRFRQGYVFGTNLHAVLRIATIRDAALGFQHFKPFIGDDLAGAVGIKVPCLTNRVSPDKIIVQ